MIEESKWLASTDGASTDEDAKDKAEVDAKAGGALDAAALLATAPPERVTDDDDMTSGAPLGAQRLAWCISVFS